MSLEEAHVHELTQRFDSILEKYVKLSVDIAPKLEQFGKYKRELQVLSKEFERRGVKFQDPESLKRMLEGLVEELEDVTTQD